MRHKKRVDHRGARVGDMRHYVLIHSRSIMSPTFGTVDFDEDFVGITAWASIKTTNGKTTMDDVGRDINVTHELLVRYNSDITSQTFIQVDDGRRFRLIDTEAYDERNEYMRLLATDRGLGEAAKA